VTAAGNHELDRAMEIGVRVSDALGERQRVPRLDQYVQTPRFDLVAFGEGLFSCLCHRFAPLRSHIDEPCPKKFGSRARRELFQSASQFLEPCIEDGAVCLSVYGDLVQPGPEPELDLVGAILE
jgi:hypothetical protein